MEINEMIVILNKEGVWFFTNMFFTNMDSKNEHEKLVILHQKGYRKSVSFLIMHLCYNTKFVKRKIRQNFKK